jgi:hypothetical protein
MHGDALGNAQMKMKNPLDPIAFECLQLLLCDDKKSAM